MPKTKVSPVGTHVPVTKGLARGGLAYADAVGAEVVQVFLSNPRGWALSPGNPVEDAAFAEGIAERGIPAYVHAPYLVNLGSPDPATLTRSAASVRHALDRGRAVGARGVVVHTGSAIRADNRERALAQVHDELLPLLEEIPADGPDLLLEPTAGGGAPLCSRVEDLADYLATLEWHPRAGVCLDTCHASAAGHDLSTARGVNATVEALVGAAGKGRLRLVHANDSKDPVGSRRDRHENVGAGSIGAAGFARLLAHSAVRGVPFVVETPGGKDRHAADIATLKELRQ